MRTLLLACAAVAAASTATASELVVDLYGMEPTGRTVYLAVFNDPAQYDAEDSRKGVIVDMNYKNAVTSATAPAMRFTFDVPDGVYSVKAFYDVDGDRTLDANFLGVPREPYGFSNNVRGVLGPPGFDETSFRVSGRTVTRIDMK